MRLQRVLVGVLGAALLGALPVALTSTSADAGTTATLGTKIFWAKQARSVYAYGQGVRVVAQVGVQCPEDPSTYCTLPDTEGDLKVYRKLGGTSSYRLLKTIADESQQFTFSSPSQGTAYYKVVYSGGTASDGTTTYTVTGSELSRRIKGSRNPHGKAVRSRGKLYFRGNVDPGWGRKPVTIQKKACKSCGWRSYKTVRTSRYGAYSVRISAPRSGRWFWRSTVGATAPRFVRGYSPVWYTYSTRTAARTLAGGIGR